MDLLNISHEIKDLLEKRRKELDITFVEEKHVYYMRDTEGVLRKTFPSVSKLLKKFYKPFDSEGMALKMCKGDPEAAALLQEEWKTLGNISTNLGSRVHYELETDLVSRYDSYKQVRRPIFECDQTQLIKSDIMISAGKTFIDLMQERGAVLLDTEIVLGDNILGYVGQPDKVWLMMNKPKTDFGIVVTDWKGLPINTPILTVNGWKTMGTLSQNDVVFDKNGKLTKIKNISKVKNVKCLKIKFDNGEEIVSDFEHRWLIFTKHNNKIKEQVMTTQEIKEYHDKLKKRESHKLLKIQNPKPLDLPNKTLPIDPYVLGLWLGDGHSSCSYITQANELVWEEIKNRGYKIGNDVSNGGSGNAKTKNIFGIRKELKKLNLINNKHLPEIYLLSSYEQRLDLLRGLMDSDGYYNKKRKRFSISTTRQSQIDYSVTILSSLGIKPTVIKYNKKINNKIIKCFNIEFITDSFNPFLKRNQDLDIKIIKNKNTYRTIISVDEVESEPTKCIEVESETSTFLFGKSLIVTHNTNQPKNFEVHHYTGRMFSPFQDLHDNALGHYYLQLPFYARLLIKMLEGTKYENINLLGCVVVLLKEDGTFEEFRVPPSVNKRVLELDLTNYINYGKKSYRY